MEIAVSVQDLHRELSGVNAVQGLTFDAYYGKVLGLLGPNGAGKTTTLRILAGLLAPTSGKLQICGLTIPKDLEQAKGKIGFLTYGMKLYGTLTPIENLRFFGRLRQLDPVFLKTRIEQLVSELGMENFCKKRFEKLSSGEQQRSAIANTLLHNPPLLILDEITLSLDIISAAFIMSFIQKEKEKGKCIILSTHVMSEVELLCDEIGFLFKGSMIELAKPQELIFRHHVTSLSESYVAAVKAAETGLRAA